MNKKGFTLIELLAVIVILAVIALIVTPVIAGIIDGAKKSSLERSVEGYISAVNVTIADSLLSANSMPNGRYFINVGNLEKNSKVYNVSFSGEKPLGGDVTIYNGKVLDGVITMNNYAVTYSNGETSIKRINKDKVYGLDYNISTKTYTRLESAEGLDACVGTNTNSCTNDFDSEEIYRDMSEVTDSYGNTFIKIPKFYIKKEVSDTDIKLFISRTRQDGYYLPFCFYDFDNNKELDYVLVGKYDSNLSDDNTKLESKSSRTPITNISFKDAQKYATNNNEATTGYQLMDVHVMDAIQTLFYIEFKTFDSQSIMAGYSNGIGPWQNTYVPLENVNNTNSFKLDKSLVNDLVVGSFIDISVNQSNAEIAHSRRITSIDKETGIVTFDGDPVNLTTASIISNFGYNSGECDNVLSSSGSSIDNTSGKYAMSYRGIENLYGNLWQYIDGVFIDNKSDGTGLIYVNSNSKNYTPGVITNYQLVTQYNKVGTNGSIGKLGFDSAYPFIQLPISTSSYDDSYYKDEYFQNNSAEIKVLNMGGSWLHRSQNGIAYYSISDGISSFFSDYSARLVIKNI